jgi:hypothetical protein
MHDERFTPIQTEIYKKFFYNVCPEHGNYDHACCSLAENRCFVTTRVRTSSSVSHLLFAGVTLTRKYGVHFPYHYKTAREDIIWSSFPEGIRSFYRKNTIINITKIIETRYKVEGVCAETLRFSPFRTIFNGHLILVFAAGYPYNALFPRTPGQIVRQLDGLEKKRKGKKNVVYIFRDTEPHTMQRIKNK